MPLQTSQKFIKELATGAGAVLMRYYRKKFQVREKKGEGIVTDADHAAENFLVRKILKKYPHCSITTEEAGKYTGDPAMHWVIDPLDGTTNFAHQMGWFCVSIGLVVDGELELGAIYQPVTDELFWAKKGKGAFLNRKSIGVSSTRSLKRSLVGTGFYYHQGSKLSAQMKSFERVSQKVQGVRRPGSAALDLAHVACGRYEGFWEKGLKPWDVAAGLLIVQEAGGTVTNYQGMVTSIHEGEMLASNGWIHRPLMQLIQS